MLTPITVEEIMHAPVETIDPGDSAREAATRLFERGIGSLVVCEGDRAVGIVTEIDVTGLVSMGRDPETATVESIMSSPLISTAPDSSIEAAAELLREHDIKRLPVLEDGAVVGIVTTTDLSNFLPHLLRRGRSGAIDATRERTSVRVDTAYENEDWEFEYRGSEAEIEVGDTVRFSKTISEDDVEAFAEASGDTNRLHLDQEFAAASRFGERIAHGTLVVGVISAALARLPGMVIYLSQDVSYLGPVELGERVTAECDVVEALGGGRFRLETAARSDGETVIDGEAVVVADEITE